MKDYKRLTEQYYPCVACKNGKCLEPQHHCEEREECEAYNRLFDLEDKIESGELCEREEVKRETAREILQELYNRCELVSEDGVCTTMVTSSNIFDLAKQFNIDLEDEE